MANIKKKEEDKKNSITLSITNKIFARFCEITEDVKGSNRSHVVEEFMRNYINQYENSNESVFNNP